MQGSLRPNRLVLGSAHCLPETVARMGLGKSSDTSQERALLMRPSRPDRATCKWSQGYQPVTTNEQDRSVKVAMCPRSETPVTQTTLGKGGGKSRGRECGRAEALCSHDPPGS